jgi:hypothetical protein
LSPRVVLALLSELSTITPIKRRQSRLHRPLLNRTKTAMITTMTADSTATAARSARGPHRDGKDENSNFLRSKIFNDTNKASGVVNIS